MASIAFKQHSACRIYTCANCPFREDTCCTYGRYYDDGGVEYDE